MKFKKGAKKTEVNHASSGKTKSEEVKTPPVSNYWRILSFGTRTEHVFILVALVSAVASGIPLPLMNIVFGHLAGDFTSYFIPGSSTTQAEFKSAVSRNALYIVYLFIGKFVLTYIGTFFFRTVGLRISAALRLRYLQALFQQPVKKLDEVSSGTVANTITTAANTIQLSVSERLNAILSALAVIIAAYAIAFTYSWQLTLVTSSAILFVILVYGVNTPFTLKALKRVETADEKHATVAAEAVASIRTVNALGAESRLIEKHSRWVDEAHKYGMKLAPQIAIQISPQFFAIYASFSLAFWYGLELYQNGHIKNVSAVIIVFFSVLIVVSVMGNVVQPLMNIGKAIAASGNFFEMIDAEPVPSGGRAGPEVSAQGDIEFKHVAFSYPTRPNVPILENFNAVFQAGKTTALVGPSGSGKSTIVALLERWYDLEDDSTSSNLPDHEVIGKETMAGDDSSGKDTKFANRGSITAGDNDISTFNIKWWRSQIGLVQQEPFLFNDTIQKNVTYGLTGTQWESAGEAEKLELVKEACREAYADDFISRLPKGYATLVGEGGIKLSGGQRQRIAIARSIIRKPSILILDEATSAIDVKGEKIVQQALDRVSKDRTTIVIAHRLSTIRKADHIIVLRNGTKIEEGTHEHLVSIEEGLYSGLVQAQALGKGAIDEEGTLDSLKPTLSRQVTDGKVEKSAKEVSTIEETEVVFGQFSQKSFFTTVGLLLYEQRSHWVWYALTLVAAMGAGSANALQSWFFAKLVQAFVYTGQQLRNAQSFWALMFFILALAVCVIYYILGFATAKVSTYVGTTCKKGYFKDTLDMPIPFFDRQENSSGSLMSQLSGDPKQLQELLGFNSVFPLISIFNVIGCIIISFYFGWKLTLVTIFAVMPVILGGSFMRVRYDFKFEIMNAKVFADSSQFATEAIGAFRTVSSLTMEDSIIERYRVLLREQVEQSTKKAAYAMLIYAFTDSVELLSMALTFWYGGQLLASREYQPVQFFVIYAAMIQGAQAAGQYLSITVNLAKAKGAANRILALRGKVRDTRVTAVSQMAPPRAEVGAKIDFRNVSFEYAENTVPLFSNLNINIEAGQFVAFVGPSGCGKTTTISLLERFYQPSSGTITFDDIDINTLEVSSYRHNLALVSQEPRLFSGTIRQNLLLGVDESTVTEDQITQACRDAEIHEFIVSLPDSYATELGLNTQTALSGGQKQRLCLARALLRRPKLLLLDEATSSLDSQSEKLVQGAIERLAGQRSMTVIAVAHRLATIQKADVIFVFGERDVDSRKGSKIVERGSHGALLAKRGVYWSMCQAQALDA